MFVDNLVVHLKGGEENVPRHTLLARLVSLRSKKSKQQVFSRQDYEGKSGKLIVAIPEGRAGVVRLRDATGATAQETAVSFDASAIPDGVWVLIVQVRKYDVIVVLSPVQFDEEGELW